MTTRLITHPACLDHDPGPYHPENPRRLEAVLGALGQPAFAKLERVSAPRAQDDQLCLVHPRSYVEGVLGSIPPAGRHQIDGDTIVSPGPEDAALRAAGAVVAGVDAVCDGRARNVFCAVRPPGHERKEQTAADRGRHARAVIEHVDARRQAMTHETDVGLGDGSSAQGHRAALADSLQRVTTEVEQGLHKLVTIEETFRNAGVVVALDAHPGTGLGAQQAIDVFADFMHIDDRLLRRASRARHAVDERRQSIGLVDDDCGVFA